MESLYSGMSHDDELKANNALLRLKLETEHGMRTESPVEIGPALENIWLTFIYDHAQARRTCGVVKLYDFVGRPAFTPLAELDPALVASELGRLCAALAKEGVVFEWRYKYDDALLYNFLTTELFEVDVDNVKMPGLVNYFTYEEFHMNNRHELERIGVGLLKSIYHHEWRPEYDALWINGSVTCNGVEYAFQQFSALILDFQQRHKLIEIENLLVDSIQLDESETQGELRASLHYRAQLRGDEKPLPRLGSCAIRFAKDIKSDHWQVVGADLPGIMAVL